MRIAMIGMGAVGSVFGMDLYNAYPDDFFAIASGSRYDRLQAEGLQVNDARYPLRVERPAEDVAPAEVIFVWRTRWTICGLLWAMALSLYRC